MKKLILVAIIATTLFSCSKEGVEPPADAKDTYLIQLKVVDFDGKIQYSPIIKVK